MITKDAIKKEIDELPDDLLENVYRIIRDIRSKKRRRKKIHSFKLGGQFDGIDIKKLVYE